MGTTHILGYPRIGPGREIKFALEAFWRGEADESYLQGVGRGLRARNWDKQSEAGLRFLGAGDFAFYDQVLNMAALLGCPPRRFGFDTDRLSLKDYFALARGSADQPAMEMTKWFDTNYHYLVPELDPLTRFGGGPDWYFDQIREAQLRGTAVKAILIGPVTFLYLSKATEPGFDRLRLLRPLAEAYARLLERLQQTGIQWVQIDEPALCLDLPPEWLDAFDRAYPVLAGRAPNLLLTTYFDSVEAYADRIVRLPVQGIHLDLVRGPSQIKKWATTLPQDWVLSAGVVDGRNIWRADLRRLLASLHPLHEKFQDRLWIAPSCSLLHVPVSLENEQKLAADVHSWLAFADQKLDEIRILGSALDSGENAVASELDHSDALQKSRRENARVSNEWVRKRLADVSADMAKRANPFGARILKQRDRLKLPPLPTTTIGSFPQTQQIRSARGAYKRREISALEYLERIRAEIRTAVERQEALGLDVLVHGEAERNDMVEYFGEQLWGFAFTENGWVQSYGSRCVKPPIIYGDVYRPEPMTVDTARYAQSLTEKPMKGMLTGPVTILQWSFVRDDQPRKLTAFQIALAIRDEVADLEKAGIGVIQIDEPAFREGLPLKRRNWESYLDWAVHAFKLSAAAAADETQIHTHMCYSEFNDILPAIAAMDADVITIETSRSKMELLDGFGQFSYPNEIGPGVYDIHSPRVPSTDEMTRLLERACGVIPPERLWVNPDCGLKTRGWPETEAALRSMVEAAHRMRKRLDISKPIALSA
ncbi:MAG: 5-methyltetrahydropteroyltriglutamate--homocysteine S-methyltransferase [Betaproteobacteria bacterium]|nr:5-methyltetrahydropteroyltriglutamate--homocysteine S-methyltransferase [Betaproteobacteria bacterium]